ncbi:YeiH family putative sulfate export transporter [Starkeya sp. 3C]|uniref:YeiH family putative sulfate export transporter n=1 Tax=Ancylobacter moscoviensis TaxID=2597768 RepID=A0ABY3DUV5_9HYPH|nr:YeiH family protein [Ancylobacter moscoviensis]TSJ64185.1 YeiH family putative sulfate export transporter [Ancylobacter moscoviensis]
MVAHVDVADADFADARKASKPRHYGIWPGIALTAAIAGAAYGLRQIPFVGVLSPMILAIMIGIGFHNLIGTPVRAREGVVFAMRRVLRAAIVLLGLQLTAAQVAEVGASGLAVIALTLAATFLFTTWLGRLMGVERGLAELIAAGTSICGASAVIATNTVTRAPDEDVAYAVACVTVFGSVAMFLYPLLPQVLDLAPHAYGLWAGASIHEIAQVVAAAYQDGPAAGDFGTVAKLSRVMLLAPVVIVLGLMATRRAARRGHGAGRARPPMPWFVLGFLGMVAVNSVMTMPAELKSVIVLVTTFLLSMALAAMGLETDIGKLRAKGMRPFLLGFAAFLFIAAFSLMLVKMTA